MAWLVGMALTAYIFSAATGCRKAQRNIKCDAQPSNPDLLIEGDAQLRTYAMIEVGGAFWRKIFSE